MTSRQRVLKIYLKKKNSRGAGDIFVFRFSGGEDRPWRSQGAFVIVGVAWVGGRGPNRPHQFTTLHSYRAKSLTGLLFVPESITLASR